MKERVPELVMDKVPPTEAVLVTEEVITMATKVAVLVEVEQMP